MRGGDARVELGEQLAVLQIAQEVLGGAQAHGLGRGAPVGLRRSPARSASARAGQLEAGEEGDSQFKGAVSGGAIAGVIERVGLEIGRRHAALLKELAEGEERIVAAHERRARREARPAAPERLVSGGSA